MAAGESGIAARLHTAATAAPSVSHAQAGDLHTADQGCVSYSHWQVCLLEPKLLRQGKGTLSKVAAEAAANETYISTLPRQDLGHYRRLGNSSLVMRAVLDSTSTCELDARKCKEASTESSRQNGLPKTVGFLWVLRFGKSAGLHAV